MLLSSLFWLLAVLLVIALIWLAASTTFNRLIGLQSRLPVDTGSVVRTSSWGDADVNGVGFRESVRVVECDNGWLVQLHWLLGSGKIWLPRNQTRVSPAGSRENLLETNRVLENGPHRVKLEGELATFVD
jgi:hypothetical protein